MKYSCLHSFIPIRKSLWLLFIALIIITQTGLSQKEWAPIGAKWYMNVSTVYYHDAPLKDYYVIESRKDTVIGSDTFRLVGNYPMLQDSGDIYYYYNDTLRLLYSFDVQVGDTLTFNILSCDKRVLNYICVVEKVDSVYLANDTLKRITCESTNYIGPYSYVYIEKVGSTRRPVEDLAGCDWIPEYIPNWLRCYEEPGLHFKTDRFATHDKECDFIDPTSGIESQETQPLEIYPNPTSGPIVIELGDITEKTDVSITDITGRFVYHQSFQGREVIELRLNQPKGIYLLRVKETDAEHVIRLMLQD